MTARQRWRLARMGLSTVLGLTPQGYFIPYRYAARTPADPLPYRPIEALFERARPAFAEILAAMDDHADALTAIGTEPPPAPRWTQDWFPRLDAAAAYVLVRRHRPRRIVEVGSGHSTRFLARAIADGGLDTAFTAIDPTPRADILKLPIRHIAATVQDAGIDPFRDLAAGDILFIDSSHIVVPGSDVDMLTNRVLAALPAGVIVHFHDICLPDPYPAAWGWRGYNEQQLVAALLLFGGFQPLFASRFVATRMAAGVAAGTAGRLPLSPDAPETGLWLRKTCPPAGPLG
ncbi:MAG: class I SAM-dependent methyltransferase [Inquilinaceae bacterium]